MQTQPAGSAEVRAYPLLVREMDPTFKSCRNRLPDPDVDASKVLGGLNPCATVTCPPPHTHHLICASFTSGVVWDIRLSRRRAAIKI